MNPSNFPDIFEPKDFTMTLPEIEEARKELHLLREGLNPLEEKDYPDAWAVSMLVMAKKCNAIFHEYLKEHVMKVHGRQVGGNGFWMWTDQDEVLADCTHEAILIGIKTIKKE